MAFSNGRKSSSKTETDLDEKQERSGFGRRRARPPVDLHLDYKDIETLKPFLTEGGRIVAARMSRLSRKQQRLLTQEVKRARQLALLPIADRHQRN